MPFNHPNLTNRTAVVTGGGGGVQEDIADITKARAEYLAGETVSINDIDWD